MYLFFIIFPVALAIIGKLVLDFYNQDNPEGILNNLIPMMLVLMTGYIFGVLIAFTLLDDRDDKVLMSLKITPISVKHYVVIKLIISFIFGYLGSTIIMYATGFLSDSSFGILVLVALSSAIQAPGVALIVNSFGKNKVEGFVIMKITGLILAFPVIAFYVSGWAQNFLGVAPGYWAARIIELEIVPSEEGSILFTFFLGMVYNMTTLWLLLKLYAKKANF